MRLLKKRRLLGRNLLFLVLLLSLASYAQECSAITVWSDDFEDGNLDGWYKDDYSTVIDGQYRSTRRSFPDTSWGVSNIYRRSNVTVGTWRFDALDIGEWEHWGEIRGVQVRFMGTDPKEGPQNGYSLLINHAATQDAWIYNYQLNRKMEGINTVLSSYDGMEGEDLRGTLHRIAITRTSAGQMSVYLNGSLILQGSDNEVSTSEYFYIRLTWDFAIDNITVDNDVLIDVGAPLGLIAIGSCTTVVLAAAVVLLKRR